MSLNLTQPEIVETLDHFLKFDRDVHVDVLIIIINFRGWNKSKNTIKKKRKHALN